MIIKMMITESIIRRKIQVWALFTYNDQSTSPIVKQLTQTNSFNDFLVS